MNELLLLLGAKDEADAIRIVNEMKTKIDGIPKLENQIADFKKKAIENRVTTLIKERKLTEDQKNFAISLAEKDPDNFETFVSNLKSANETYSKEDAELKVQEAINQKKILPAQKESLVNLGLTDKKALDDFLNAAGVVVLGTAENLTDPSTLDPVENYQVKTEG